LSAKNDAKYEFLGNYSKESKGLASQVKSIHWNTFQGSLSPSEISDGGVNIKSAEVKLDDLPGGTHVHYDEL
jgi:hypothetical protein